MRSIQAVLFDMDGTVFDSERVYREGFRLAAKEMGLPPSVVDHHPVLCGLPRDESRRYMKGVFGEDFPYDDWRERMWQYAAEVFEENGPPRKDGVPEILIELREMGIRTAIATATRLPVATQYLQKSGLAPYFDTVVTGPGKVYLQTMTIGKLAGLMAPMIAPISAPGISMVDLGLMTGLSALLIPMMKTGMTISRREGCILFLIYIGYTIWLISCS